MFSYLNESAKEYEYLIKAVGALLPFIITVFMAYIAYQQWQTNERQRKQELFEMRHKHLIEPIKQILSELHKNKIYDLNLPLESFINDFYKYRFLISEYDAHELNCKFKIMLKNYNLYVQNKIKFDKYIQELAYNLQYVEEVLSSYIYIEENKFFNLYSITKKFFECFIKLFMPIIFQQKYINKKRKKIAIKKVEKIADDFEIINNGGKINVL